MTAALVDAGPLVAILDRSDPHHSVCVDALRSLQSPLLTVWPVLSEAVYLLSSSWRVQRELLGDVIGGALKVLPLDEADVPRMRDLMEKYRDLPMDLADAALVRVAERERIHNIFTLDRRDFSLYRPARLGRFQIIP
jgi:predicted nucleic acid-binding protein